MGGIEKREAGLDAWGLATRENETYKIDESKLMQN